MQRNGQRRADLVELLKQEPEGLVNIKPHVADDWYKTVPGTPPEPHVSDSHVAVIRRCIQEGLPYCLILEDDAVWDPEVVTLHSTFQRAIEDLNGRAWSVCTIRCTFAVLVLLFCSVGGSIELCLRLLYWMEAVIADTRDVFVVGRSQGCDCAGSQHSPWTTSPVDPWSIRMQTRPRSSDSHTRSSDLEDWMGMPVLRCE